MRRPRTRDERRCDRRRAALQHCQQCVGAGNACASYDAGAACDVIAQQIRTHGGTDSTCNEPTPMFEDACAALAQCRQCTGT